MTPLLCEPGWKFPPSAIEWFQCQATETLEQDIVMNPNNVSLTACHNTPAAAYTHATLCKQADEFNYDMIYSVHLHLSLRHIVA